MKIALAITVLVCVASPFAMSLRAQQTVPVQPQATSVPSTGAIAAATIDPEKEADIRKLLELSNTKAMFNQTIGTMLSLIQKSLLQSNPDDPKAQMLANLI